MKARRHRRRLLQAWLTAGVLALAMGLLVLGQRVAQQGQADLRVLQDQIASLRQATLEAQLHGERMLRGDAASGLDLVRTSLQRAQAIGDDIVAGRGGLRDALRQRLPTEGTRRSAQTLVQALAELDSLLARQEQGAGEAIGLALRQAQRQLDAALSELEAQSLAEFDGVRRQQWLLGLATLALLAGAGTLFLLWQRRAAAEADRDSAALAARSAELEAFAAAVPDLSFLLDAEGNFLRAHASRPELLVAPSAADVVGRNLRDFFAPAQAEGFLSLLRHTLEEGSSQAEYRLQLDGSERVFEARTTAVKGSRSVVWVSWDVTERVRRGERIEQLGRLYGMLSACNQAVVFSADEAALFDRVLAAATGTGGYQAAWIAGSGGQVLASQQASGVAPAALLRLQTTLLEDSDSPLAELLSGPPPALRVHCRRLSPRPEQAWSQAAAAASLHGLSLVCLGDAGAARRVLVLHAAQSFDFEPEHQALLAEVAGDLEFALQQFELRRRSLRQDARLRLQAQALQASRDGMLLLDAEGRSLAANSAACEFIGGSEEDLLGKRPRLLADIAADPQAQAELEAALGSGRSWQGEVLARHAGGRMHTLLLSASALHDSEREQAVRVLVFTDITEQRESDARLQRIAHFDALTGLPNRELLIIRLDAALKRARSEASLGAVVMLDLDDFRTVNESGGWGQGDELLQRVALRLGECLRAGDTLSRLGGDEFVIVLERLAAPHEAERFAERLQAGLRAPFQLSDGQRVYTQASLGVMRFADCEGEAGDLLRLVEVALFEAKRAGRNAWRSFQPAMGVQAEQRLALETRLREALQRQQFKLVYQPLVELASGRLVGVEALVRLDQPELPRIGPDVFIPLLEQTGQINALGDWVTLEACLQGRRWLDAGWDFGCVAVNLSPAEVSRYAVEARVRRALESSGLPAEKLELEITESGLMEQGERAEAFLRELHGLGVSLSIDDFGTGYSSLASLKRFPVRKLKIDRSFIIDLGQGGSDAFIVEAVVGVGHRLGIEVLAEGVETELQRDLLLARGCRLAQGYLFSPPLEAETLWQRFGPPSGSRGVPAKAP